MDKFAVIKYNKEQYKVSEGELVKIAKLEGKEGDKLTFDEVLLKSDGKEIAVGKPVVTNAKVTAEIVRHGKDEKIKMMVFKAKSRYRKRKGHRQDFTEIKIS